MIRIYTFALLVCICNCYAMTDNSSIATSSTIDSTFVSSNEIVIKVHDSIHTSSDPVVTISTKNIGAYPPAFKDYRRLGYNTGIFAGAAIIGFGVLWVMPESATNWDKQKMKEKGLLWKWKRNVKEGPVWDKDNWVLNWVTHPYCGGVYYMTARSSGFNRLESFGYSAVMSTFFWEYGIESFAEVPSVQDLLITPVVGSVVGEGFFYAKKSIVRHDKRILKSRALGMTALLIMDPFNTILDGFGYKEKVKTQMNIAPVGVNQFSKTPVWGVSFSASF